ncbi:MAG: 50S ribosomal protein L4 [Saprospiraceae bacterium]
MKLDILNIQGGKTGRTIELPADVFGIEPNENAVYLAVKQYLANQRQGTHKSKERSEISRTTKKAFRQKGTGGARRGDMKSPLVYGGGRAFGPRPRDYSFKLNLKVRQLARKSALSNKAANGQIMVVENIAFDAPKTREFAAMLKNLNVSGKKALVITPEYDANVYMSGRNMPRAGVMVATDLNTYAIMNTTALVLTEASISKIVENFA